MLFYILNPQQARTNVDVHGLLMGKLCRSVISLMSWPLVNLPHPVMSTLCCSPSRTRWSFSVSRVFSGQREQLGFFLLDEGPQKVPAKTRCSPLLNSLSPYLTAASCVTNSASYSAHIISSESFNLDPGLGLDLDLVPSLWKRPYS